MINIYPCAPQVFRTHWGSRPDLRAVQSRGLVHYTLPAVSVLALTLHGHLFQIRPGLRTGQCSRGVEAVGGHKLGHTNTSKLLQSQE